MITRRKLCTLCFFFCALGGFAQQEIFVSQEGNDTHKGRIKSPFATIERALIDAKAYNGETTIFLREGTYRLDQPIVLTHEDGNKQKKLNIRAFPNEEVVISGSQQLTLNWRPYKNGILQAELKNDLHMDMLVVNGEIRHMARFPNFDKNAVRFNGTSAEATSPKRAKKWKHPETGYVHAMHRSDWGDFHYRITGKDRKGELQLEGGWQNNRQYGLHPDNRMVENIFEELDAPGEWFYNREKGILYYYPLEGEDMQKATVESPQLKHLIEVKGTEHNPVANICLQHLKFTQTLRTFMEEYEPLLRSDWTVYRGAALYFEGTENCKIQDCDLYNLGGNAVFFSYYNRQAEVSGSHFTNIGASAICFVGDPKAVRSPSFEYGQFVPVEKIDRQVGPKGKNFPANCLVEDNLIHKIGLFEKQITGVELSMCQSITVSHNSIYDTPRAGINISEGTWGGHLIEHNDVFDTVKETGDHGSFNSWGRDRFWHPNPGVMTKNTTAEPALILLDAVKTNTIYHNRFRCDRGWDIDLDDGSSNYHIYNNLCLNGGIKLREGFYRVVENNIMVNNSFHPHVWFPNSGDVFARNIVMTEYKPIQIKQWGRMVDYNLFPDSISLQKAQENGTDAHSLVCQLEFKNPMLGDFSLPNHADAIVKGSFQNFPMDDFGVQSARLKALARQPEMPKPLSPAALSPTHNETWQGLSIKTMNTWGERSATGMDAERGIYIINADEAESLHTHLKANDVILKINGCPTNNLDEFHEVIKTYKVGTTLKLVVFREQKENMVTFQLK